MCRTAVSISLEHLLSMSVLVRNVSVWNTYCQCLCWWEMCQFGALVVNVCAGEKCVELLWASVWSTCCQCLCWWEMCQFGTPIVSVCAGEKCVSLEHLLSMSVLVRNVSVWNTYCQCLCWWEMCQFGTPIVSVCAGEKCVSLEHLLSVSVLVRNVSVWNTYCQCLCWWEMCQFGALVVSVCAGEKWTAVQGSSMGSAKQKTSRMPWMGSSTSLAKSWGLHQRTISRRYRTAILFSISLNWFFFFNPCKLLLWKMILKREKRKKGSFEKCNSWRKEKKRFENCMGGGGSRGGGARMQKLFFNDYLTPS